MNAIEYIENEEGYLDWIKNNPGGFVINLRNNKSPKEMILHRAYCRSITKLHHPAKPGGFTERDYIKVCANDIQSLREWVRKNGRTDGSFTIECSKCNP